MESIFCEYLFDFLISHGVTNFVDIDGLIYAPLTDVFMAALEFGLKFHNFVSSIVDVAIFGFVVMGASVYVMLFARKRVKNKENSYAADDPPCPSGEPV